MDNSKELKLAIALHLKEVISNSALDRVADDGAISLLLQELELARKENDFNRAMQLITEAAKVSKQIGISRGRFDLANEILKLLLESEETA